MDADPRILLAGWLHWIAFDLIIGTLLLWRLRARGVRHPLILLPLALVFLAGPLGWLGGALLKATRCKRIATELPLAKPF